MNSIRPLLPALTALWLVSLTACSKTEPPPEPIRAVRIMTVTAQALRTERTYAGEVKARTESRLGFRVAGKLSQRMVQLGDTVKAGQLLAVLDPQDYALGQASAAAADRAAKANLAVTQADWKRFKALYEQGFISQAELQRREAALQAAQAQAEQAQAQLNVQGNQASYTRLLADGPGVVTGIDADPGTVLAAGTPVLRVAQDGPKDVVFAVPEQQVQRFRRLVGQSGVLQVQVPGEAEAWPATLRELAAAADPVTRTFLAKVDIGAGTALKLGQTAHVVLLADRQGPPVIKVPLSALRGHQGQSAVWLLDRDAMVVRSAAVQVSGADGNQAVIPAGLQAGQTVVTAGVHVLQEGLKVKVYQEPSAPAAVVPALPQSPASVSPVSAK